MNSERDLRRDDRLCSWRSVASALAVLIVVFFLSKIASDRVLEATGYEEVESFAKKNAVFKIVLLIFSVVAIGLMKWREHIDFGFGMGLRQNYGRITRNSALLALLGMFILIACNVIGVALTGSLPVGFPDERLVDRILWIWILSSVSEEILFRGLFQSMLGSNSPQLIRIFGAPISTAVALSGLAFAAVHLSLLWEGMSPWFVSGIVVFTSIVGIYAALLRERSGSILPAIWAHIVFNIVGSIPVILKQVVN